MAISSQVLVVGAGLAGSATAIALARAGARTALVDRAVFPRPKTCGSCLNGRAVAALERLGLDLVGLCPNPLSAFELRAAGRRAAFALPGNGVALSRTVLDDALLRMATAEDVDVHQGVEVLDTSLCGTGAPAGHARRIVRARNTATGEPVEFRAPLVVAADGIASPLARAAGLVLRPGPHAVVGASAILDTDAVSPPPPRDAVAMFAGPEGYCGLVRLEDGRWNAAACLRADKLCGTGAPAGRAGNGMIALLDREGVRLSPDAKDALRAVRPCPPLRRAVRRPWAERLLLVGDAAGYCEPITGEGMAWALEGAERLAPLAARGWSRDLGPAWERAWRAVVGRRVAVRVAAALLRQPRALAVAMVALPLFGSVVAARIDRRLSPAGGLP